MGIPLVRSNSVDDINTSLIAIRRAMRNSSEGGDMGDVNVNVDVKYEVTDTVEDGNSLPVTSQGVYDYVEGQGFTPVDEVEKNNMKAVTSNAVAKSLSYSTTEQKTGGVWIDGKMIYRKVFSGLNFGNSTTGSTGVTLSDCDTLIDVQGFGKVNNKHIKANYAYTIESGTIIYYSSLTFGGNTVQYLVVEYTKAD